MLSFSLFPANSNAKEIVSGYELKSRCLEQDGTVAVAFCLGYITGISQLYNGGNSGSNFNICFPEGVSVGQLQDIYIKWANENPEKLHESGLLSLTLSMQKAFPCKSGDAT